MTEVVGHATVLHALSQHLPPVTLLLGPAGIGKRMVADRVMDAHGVLPVDRIELDQLTTHDARSLCERVQVTPFGRVRGVRIRLDQATDAALNALLTVLETPPDTTRFLLLAASAPATVRSRAQVWHCGLLTRRQSEQVLRNLGMSGSAVTASASRARGQALPAMPADDEDRAKRVVLRTLHAVLTRDRALFLDALPSWNVSTGQLLRCAVLETLTGRWRMFEPDEPGLSPHQAQRLLLMLNKLPLARDALALRVSLEPFLTGAIPL